MSVGIIVFFYVTMTGITRWSGRSMTLLIPTYAKKYIPIIASVSEHQPTTWGVFFMDLQNLLIFMPVGLFFCFRKVTFGSLFLALYGILAVYFSCVMIRLLLVLAPSVCVLAGIGVSEVSTKMIESIKESFYSSEAEDNKQVAQDHDSSEVSQSTTSEKKDGKDKKKKKGKGADGSSHVSNSQSNTSEPKKSRSSIPLPFAVMALLILCSQVTNYVFHSVQVAAEAYSSPSVVLAGR